MQADPDIKPLGTVYIMSTSPLAFTLLSVITLFKMTSSVSAGMSSPVPINKEKCSQPDIKVHINWVISEVGSSERCYTGLNMFVYIW